MTDSNSKSKNRAQLIILIIGLLILIVGVGFQLYGINNGDQYASIGGLLNACGLIASAIGLLLPSLQGKKQNE